MPFSRERQDCPAVRGDRAAGGKGFPGLNCARVCVYRCTFRRRRDFQGNRRFSKDSVMQRYTASFLGRDCPGVVATVSRILGETGCNIVEVTQTILSGEFAAIFVVQAPEGRSAEELREQLTAGLAEAQVDLSVLVRPAIELLAGIPSVIYGLLGILILNPLMYKLELKIFEGSTTHQFTGGANLISAVLVLALMILPTVINISESALRSVPRELRSASLALGATKIQTIFQVVLPAAKSGIITAIVLGTGRAIGEAMAISLVSGSSVNFPLPFNSVRFLTTAIVSEMSYSAGLHKQVLFTIGLVLFAFIMIINISLTRLLKKGDVQHD